MKRRPLATAAALLTGLLLLLTACGGAEDVTPDPSASAFGTVRIGKGYSPETEAIAWLYSGILEEAGYTTEVVDTGDSRSSYLEAMEAGGSQSPLVTPDYSGNLLLELTEDGARTPSGEEQSTSATAGEAPAASATASSVTASSRASASASPTPTGLNVQGMSTGDIVNMVARVLPEQLSTLDAAEAQNKDALVVTKATAAQYGLSSIDDLAEHCSALVFGTPTGFADRSYGTSGLKGLYGCTPGRYQEIDDQSELVDRLADGTVQVADLFTASAAISTNDFVVLDDPQADFIAQQVIPVVQDEKLPGSAKNAINNVSSRLKSQDLTRLDQLMSGEDALSAEEAADFWLQEGSD